MATEKPTIVELSQEDRVARDKASKEFIKNTQGMVAIQKATDTNKRLLASANAERKKEFDIASAERRKENDELIRAMLNQGASSKKIASAQEKFDNNESDRKKRFDGGDTDTSSKIVDLGKTLSTSIGDKIVGLGNNLSGTISNTALSVAAQEAPFLVGTVDLLKKSFTMEKFRWLKNWNERRKSAKSLKKYQVSQAKSAKDLIKALKGNNAADGAKISKRTSGKKVGNNSAIDGLVKMLKKIKLAMMMMLRGIIGGIASAIAGVVVGIASFAVAIGTALAPVFIAIGAFLAPFAGIIAAVVGIGLAIYWVYKNWDNKIVPAFKQLWKGMKNVGKWVLGLGKKFGNYVWDVITAPYKFIAKLGKGLWAVIKKQFSEGFDFKVLIKDIGQVFTDAFKPVIDKIVGVFESLFQGIVDMVANLPGGETILKGMGLHTTTQKESLESDKVALKEANVAYNPENDAQTMDLAQTLRDKKQKERIARGAVLHSKLVDSGALNDSLFGAPGVDDTATDSTISALKDTEAYSIDDLQILREDSELTNVVKSLVDNELRSRGVEVEQRTFATQFQKVDATAKIRRLQKAEEVRLSKPSVSDAQALSADAVGSAQKQKFAAEFSPSTSSVDNSSINSVVNNNSKTSFISDLNNATAPTSGFYHPA